MTKLWAGRFCTSTNEKVERFQASIFFDRRLYEEDILGSAIHAKMLHLIGILDKEEIKSVLGGLKEVLHKFHTAEVSVKYADEDIHMLVENLLREEIGPLAGKLHTGRSRNDQVALDMHLYFRKSSLTAIYLILTLVETLAELSKTNIDVTLPGYTHLQRAQPVLLSHHLLAYGWMFLRDAKRFFDTYHACNISPLGSGAIAGSTFPLDREYVRQQLKFSSFYPNSMDAVSNRDYLLDYLNSASTCMMHLSRLSEEIVLWASAEFRFIELSDNFCTGSSMMPQKKNPDVPELIRGKSGRVYGSLFGLYTLLKGLPLTYNKDMQEDKEGAFDAEYTLTNSLSLMEGLLKEAKFLEVSMKYATENDFSNATDLADYLVQ
jgi:argininosuccinate lyase